MACNISPSSQAEELSTPFFRPQTFYFEEIQTYEKVKKNSTVTSVLHLACFFFWMSHSRVGCRHHGTSSPDISTSISEEQKRSLL